jgi:hypothetical protein
VASIIETYAAEVLPRINGGGSYQSVCDWLSERGVHITRQSVCSWYLRKNKKILKRSLIGNKNASLTLKTEDGNTLPKGVQPKPLHAFIQESEQQILLGKTQFVAKPKHDALAGMASILSKRTKK